MANFRVLFCFFRGKRRADKQYHSDDGYTSDPGVLREVSNGWVGGRQEWWVGWADRQEWLANGG